MPLHFTQSCPTCGRRLQVPTRLLQQQVACQHCHAQFIAGVNEDENTSWHGQSQDLMARAEAVLRQTRPIEPPAVSPAVS
jgi:uncharacterized paraquat-inducible protein A